MTEAFPSRTLPRSSREIGNTCRRKLVTIIGRGPGPKAETLTVFSGDDFIPVEFNFMQPARSGRWPVRQRRLARQVKPGGLERVRIGPETRQSIGPAI